MIWKFLHEELYLIRRQVPDAARSTVVKPKTATEANIMQQSLSARVSEFRDQIEDFLKVLAQYTAEILLLTIGPERVAEITGQHTMQQSIDPVTGMTVSVPVRLAYDWPDMPREKVFDLVQLTIRSERKTKRYRKRWRKPVCRRKNWQGCSMCAD